MLPPLEGFRSSHHRAMMLLGVDVLGIDAPEQQPVADWAPKPMNPFDDTDTTS